MTNNGIKTEYARLQDRLGEVRREQLKVRARRGLYLFSGTFFLLVVVVTFAEALGHFSVPVRTALFLVTVAACLGFMGWFLGPSVARWLGLIPGPDDDALAGLVGRHFPGVRDRLLNAFQLVRSSSAEQKVRTSDALVEAAFRQVNQDVKDLDFLAVVNREPSRRAGKLALILAGVALVPILALPVSMGSGFNRLLHFSTSFASPAPFLLQVSPGDREVVKGESVEIEVRASGKKKPAGVELFLLPEGQEAPDRHELEPGPDGVFRYSVPSLRRTTTYFVQAGSVESPEFVLTVVDRPVIRTFRVKLQPPRYSGQREYVLDENIGDVSALAGTRVNVEATCNKDLASAALVFGSGDSLSMNIEGTRIGASFLLKKTDTYRFALRDVKGIANADPITYSLKALPDAYPRVMILEPEGNVNLGDNMILPMLVRLSDDFGFTRLRLAYRLARSKYEQPSETFSFIDIPLPSRRSTEVDVPYVWKLASLNLVPEDVVEFYVEVFDNDQVTGPKSARSRSLLARLPSMEEVFAQADKVQEQAVEDLKEALREANDIKKSLDDVNRELKKQNLKQPDWQQKKKVEELLKRQEEVRKKVEQVTKSLENMTSQLDRQQVLSPETMQKYMELQKLMQELDAPELMRAMRKLNEAMRNMPPDQVRKSLENFQFNEEMFRKSIERTMELLKRIQIEQKVDEVTRRTEELAKKQEDVRKKTEQSQSQEELNKRAEEQKRLDKELQELAKQMQELVKRMSEFPDEMPLQDMKDAQAQANLMQMSQQMRQAAGMCQGGKKSSAAQMQRQMEQQLRELQKRMKNIKKKMRSMQQQQVLNAFRKALQQMLSLSQRQEELKNKTQSLPANSQQFREMAERQQRLMEQLARIAEDMMELSKKTMAVTPEMGRQMGKAFQMMESARKSLENRSTKSAGQQQGGAMAALNDAAKKIAQSMQASRQGKGMPSLMQQLQQMASRQQGINSMTQKLGRGKLSPEQMMQLQRLVAEQQAVQKTLEQLQQEARKSVEGERILGDLDRIRKDIQEVLSDMRNADINPETIENQERILSRLLDASRSTRTRDYEKRRESRTGTDVVRRSPGEINAEERASRLQRDLLRAMEEGYSGDYEALIRQYFEALQKLSTGADPNSPQ